MKMVAPLEPAIVCFDMERMLMFYVDILGLRREPRPHGIWCVLSTPAWHAATPRPGTTTACTPIDESAAAFQRAVHLSPQTPRMHGALGRTFALAGRRKQALEVLRKLESYAKERYVSPLEFAWIQFALGETDLGFRWMQKAVEDRSFDLISIKVDPRYDALKGDPRFEAIARRMGVVSAT